MSSQCCLGDGSVFVCYVTLPSDVIDLSSGR